MPGHLPARPGPAFAWPVLLALMVMLAGCVRLVSNYDETLDRQLTAYAEKSDKFLLRMGRLAGTPEGTYGQNAGYYDDARGDLSTMRIRSGSQPNNDITTEQIANLEQYLDQVEKLHQAGGNGGMPMPVIARLRQSNSQAIGAALALEMAKKRGGK
jgi:hypothetical protein